MPRANWILVALLLPACTRLDVNRLDSGAVTWQQRAGITYALPFTQYKIDVTRGIARCEVDVPQVPGIEPSEGAPKLPVVKSFVKAAITSELVDDGDHVYVIDVESLSGMTKITDITVNWNEGRLVSINASADDQSAEVISATVSGVAKLATSAIDPTAFAASTATREDNLRKKFTFVECNQETKDSVESYLRNKGASEQLSKDLAGLINRIEKERERLDKLGSGDTVDCADDSNKTHPRCALLALMAEHKSKQADLTGAQRAMEASLARISYTQTYRWPESSSEGTSRIHPVADARLSKWVKESTRWLDYDAKVPPNLVSLDAFKNDFGVVFSMGRIGSYGRSEPGSDEAGARADDGIRYRVPATGFVAVCAKLTEANKARCDRDIQEDMADGVRQDNVVATLEGPIHQLGYLFHIPFESKAFTNGNVQLKFDKEGRLEMARVAQTESSAENFANVFKGFVDEYAKYRAVEEAEEETELSRIQEEVELLNAQKALKDAQKALSDEVLPLTELQNQIALAEAQKRYLDALSALEPSNPPSAEADELAIVNSEVVLLQAEIARLEALIRRNELEEQLNP